MQPQTENDTRSIEPSSEPVKTPATMNSDQPVAEPVEKPTESPSEAFTAGSPTANPTRDTPLDEGDQDDYVVDEAPEPLPVKCANTHGNTTFCPGLLPASVARVHLRPGCVLFSVNDLTQITNVHKYQESAILVVCSSSASGVVKIDGSTLEDFDMIFQDQSMISSIIFGPHTQLHGFSGNNFTGMDTVLKPPPSSTMLSLDTAYFEGVRPRVSTNDNIKSFEYISSSELLNSCEDAMNVYYLKDLKFNAKHDKRSMNKKLSKRERRSLRGL